MSSNNSGGVQRADTTIQRNPHPDFKKVEASRADWPAQELEWKKVPSPDWKPGSGGNDGGASLEKGHIDFDPHEPGRPAVLNYKLMISAITPRFVGFLSTVSADGQHHNLAPYSFTTMITHDPPLFVVGHAGGISNAKDTLKNILDTKEAVMNVVSEHFIEAANFTSINAPHGVSEWALSGLHPAPSKTVKPRRVKESIFSVECKLVDTREFESRATPGKISNTLIILEGTRFWAREDAINEERSLIDPGLLRPMSRIGGISYGRMTQVVETPRPRYEELNKDGSLDALKEPAIEG